MTATDGRRYAPRVAVSRARNSLVSRLPPDLSGRENIFMNGAILGMARKETARRFDEIVAFSEIEDFLDTPVRHYSSGMFMRLAFAASRVLSRS